MHCNIADRIFPAPRNKKHLCVQVGSKQEHKTLFILLLKTGSCELNPHGILRDRRVGGWVGFFFIYIRVCVRVYM